MMINTSKIYNFYDQENDGKCKYINERGPRMSMRCNTNTNDSYCPQHSKRSVTAEKAVGFLRELSENPEDLDRLLKSGSFYLVCHPISDHHNYGDGYECEDCYSGDTEHEADYDLKRITKDIFENSNFWDGEDAEEDAEEESE